MTGGAGRVGRIIVTWLATARGGAEKSSFELCRAIRRHYEIDVVLVLWHYGEMFDFSGMQGDLVNVVHCRSAAEYGEQVAAALVESSSSTVLVSNHRTFLTDLAIADRARVASIVVFRQTPMVDHALRTLSCAHAGDLGYRTGDELDWSVLGRADALVGISEFGADGISSFAAPQRVTHIYNGLEMPLAKPNLRQRRVRRFLIVSRLIDWKRVDFGLLAFARLCRDHSDVTLQIAGDGGEEHRLRVLAERLGVAESVNFLGFVTDIESVYATNDCLLHLSPIESFGRVVVEAALCGLPAVVPQSAATGEVVINNVTGLTFEPHNLADCVRAMDQAYSLTPTEFERLATAAQQRARTVFGTARLADAYVSLAASLVDR